MLILYIVLGIIGLIIILSIIAPKKYNVERSVIIDRPLPEVYKYLTFIKNQDYWSPWKKRDPNMKQVHTGVDGKIGFVNKWDSSHKQLGTGEQELVTLVENEKIESELRFLKPFKSTSTGYFLVKELAPSKTEVTWGFRGTNKPPMNIMMMFFNMDKAVGKDFEEGLAKLKEVLEN